MPLGSGWVVITWPHSSVLCSLCFLFFAPKTWKMWNWCLAFLLLTQKDPHSCRTNFIRSLVRCE